MGWRLDEVERQVVEQLITMGGRYIEDDLASPK